MRGAKCYVDKTDIRKEQAVSRAPRERIRSNRLMNPIYSHIAGEPIPEAILRLIRELGERERGSERAAGPEAATRIARRPSRARKEPKAEEDAQTRGLRLLKENLTPAQREQYERYGYFDVTGGDTGRQYRIRHGSQGNVILFDERHNAVGLLCFMPKGDLVVGDILLAQKVALELFETEALKVANCFPGTSNPLLRRQSS